MLIQVRRDSTLTQVCRSSVSEFLSVAATLEELASVSVSESTLGVDLVVTGLNSPWDEGGLLNWNLNVNDLLLVLKDGDWNLFVDGSCSWDELGLINSVDDGSWDVLGDLSVAEFGDLSWSVNEDLLVNSVDNGVNSLLLNLSWDLLDDGSWDVVIDGLLNGVEDGSWDLLEDGSWDLLGHGSWDLGDDLSWSPLNDLSWDVDGGGDWDLFAHSVVLNDLAFIRR